MGRETVEAGRPRLADGERIPGTDVRYDRALKTAPDELFCDVVLHAVCKTVAGETAAQRGGSQSRE